MSIGESEESGWLDDVISTVPQEIHVLHIDDDPALLDMSSVALEEVNDRLSVTMETSAAAGLDRLADSRVDCIVSDYQMPEMNGLEFLDAVRDQNDEIPFILYTGKGSEEIAAKAIEEGVSSYLQKESGLDHYTVLANRIKSLVTQYYAQQRVRQSFQALEASRDGIAVFDSDGVFQYVNPSYANAYGYEPGELIGSHWTHLYPEHEVEYYNKEVVPALHNDDGWMGECECLHRDGSVFHSTHSISKIENNGHVCIIHHGSVSQD